MFGLTYSVMFSLNFTKVSFIDMKETNFNAKGCYPHNSITVRVRYKK